MKLFRLDPDQRSYKTPILKLIVCLLFLILLWVLRINIPIENETVNTIVGFVTAGVGVAGILCLAIAACDLIVVSDNRDKDKRKRQAAAQAAKNGQEIDLAKVVSLAKDNDIIVFEIVADGEPFEVGSSAECDNGSSRFYNKRFCIDEQEFEDADAFEAALAPLAKDGKLLVLSVDDVPVDQYF